MKIRIYRLIYKVMFVSLCLISICTYVCIVQYEYVITISKQPKVHIICTYICT